MSAVARLVVDHDRCGGLGLCEAQAEHIFQIQDDGSLLVLSAQIADEDLDAVRRACESCPTEALRLEE